MKSVCRLVLNLIGWKIVERVKLPDKSVICVAPHTSNWDLLLGLIVYKSMGRRAYFLIKKEWFFFPMSLIFKMLGGIPVDRSRKTSLTDQMTERYNSMDKFEVAITPEATRKRNPEWKKGFYYIALAANVPIVVAAIDYKKKEVDFKKIIIPSGDVDADMLEIKEYYKDVSARHPKNFAL